MAYYPKSTYLKDAPKTSTGLWGDLSKYVTASKPQAREWERGLASDIMEQQADALAPVTATQAGYQANLQQQQADVTWANDTLSRLLDEDKTNDPSVEDAQKARDIVANTQTQDIWTYSPDYYEQVRQAQKAAQTAENVGTERGTAEYLMEQRPDTTAGELGLKSYLLGGDISNVSPIEVQEEVPEELTAQKEAVEEDITSGEALWGGIKSEYDRMGAELSGMTPARSEEERLKVNFNDMGRQISTTMPFHYSIAPFVEDFSSGMLKTEYAKGIIDSALKGLDMTKVATAYKNSDLYKIEPVFMNLSNEDKITWLITNDLITDEKQITDLGIALDLYREGKTETENFQRNIATNPTSYAVLRSQLDIPEWGYNTGDIWKYFVRKFNRETLSKQGNDALLNYIVPSEENEFNFMDTYNAFNGNKQKIIEFYRNNGISRGQSVSLDIYEDCGIDGIRYGAERYVDSRGNVKYKLLNLLKGTVSTETAPLTEAEQEYTEAKDKYDMWTSLITGV